MGDTYLSNSLKQSEDKAKYDENAKKILSDKNILAWILKDCVEEFSGYMIEEIKQCIVGDITISNDGEEPEKSEAIVGESQESNISGEGFIRYDIRLSVVTGKEADENPTKIKLLINVEAQQEFYLSYDFETRGLFYCCRMISEQMYREFKPPHYEGIKKVYSIWICFNAPKKYGGTIAEYKMGKRDILGNYADNKKSYDKIAVTIMCINDDTITDKISSVNLLGNVFSDKKTFEEKKRIIENNYGIMMERNVEGEVNVMGGLGDAIERRGIQKGLIQGIKALVEMCEELSWNYDDTTNQIRKKFDLTEEKAKDYMQEFWKEKV